MLSEILAFQLIKVILLGIFSTFVAFSITPLVSNFLFKHHLGKQIRTDAGSLFSALHGKKEGTPTMAGIIIWGTVLIVTLLFFLLDTCFDGIWKNINFLSRAQVLLPLGAMLGAALIGLIDDLLGVWHVGPHGGGLAMKEKLIFYSIVALIGAWWFSAKLGFSMITIPFIGTVDLGVFYVPWVIFILLATTFSANETNGLDGLLEGTALVAFSCYLIIAFVQGKYDLAAFLAVLLGSLVAFLWYNIHPARFFMGDTGSMALGVTLGVIAFLTDTVFYLPFFAFIWLVESLSVILQLNYKKFKKRKLFLITPLHHHFEALGWPETKVTMRFWLISAMMALLGLALYFLDLFMI